MVDRVKELKKHIKMNKSRAAVVKVNNESTQNIGIDNIDKLTNSNNLKYVRLRKTIKITTKVLFVCNYILHLTDGNK